MFSGLNNFIKYILPKRLFYRALIIVAAPTIILQVIITIVFYDSVWIKANKNITRSLVAQLKAIEEVYKNDNTNLDFFTDSYKNNFNFEIGINQETFPKNSVFWNLWHMVEKRRFSRKKNGIWTRKKHLYIRVGRAKNASFSRRKLNSLQTHFGPKCIIRTSEKNAYQNLTAMNGWRMRFPDAKMHEKISEKHRWKIDFDKKFVMKRKKTCQKKWVFPKPKQFEKPVEFLEKNGSLDATKMLVYKSEMVAKRMVFSGIHEHFDARFWAEVSKWKKAWESKKSRPT